MPLFWDFIPELVPPQPADVQTQDRSRNTMLRLRKMSEPQRHGDDFFRIEKSNFCLWQPK